MTTFTFVAAIWILCWLTIAIVLACWAVGLKRWIVRQVRNWRVRQELNPRLDRMAHEFREQRLNPPMTAETIRAAKLAQARGREELRQQTGAEVDEDGRVLFFHRRPQAIH